MPILASTYLESLPTRSTSLYRDDPAPILARARLLGQDDRLLVELALQSRVSRRKLGQIFHVPAGTVTRRLQRLARRLHDPVVIDLLDDSCPLTPEYRQVGIERFLRGQSAAAIADKHRMRPADVRLILHFVKGWHNGIHLKRDWGKVKVRN
jgi:DNA-directed RNA polymerase specialized sigma24 family protein